MTNGGVFSIENPGFWDSSLRDMAPGDRAMRMSLGTSLHGRKSLPPPFPTFTKGGKENEVILHVGEYTHVLWFPQQYAVNLRVDESKTLKRPYKRCVYTIRPSFSLWCLRTGIGISCVVNHVGLYTIGRNPLERSSSQSRKTRIPTHQTPQPLCSLGSYCTRTSSLRNILVRSSVP